VKLWSSFRSPVSGPSGGSVLRLPPGWPAVGGQVDWYSWDTQGRHSSGEAASLDTLPPAVHAGAMHVWTAAADTLLTQVRLPPASRAKMMQALPFALEDQVSSEPEQLNFCVDRAGVTNGTLAVAITGRERLAEWSGAFSAAGLSPRSLCPVICAVPWEEGEWTLTWDRHETWLRTGRSSGLCCTGEWSAVRRLLEITLAEARAGKHGPQRLLLINAPEDVDKPELQATLGIAAARSTADPFTRWPADLPFNLLESGTASANDGPRRALRAFGPALVCLALWAGLWLITDIIEWTRLRSEDVTQREAMTALFRQSFPDARSIVDPALQMERNLAQLQGARGPGQASDFLSLLSRASPALLLEGKLTSVKYDGSALQVDMEFAAQASAEAARAALAGRGLKADIVDSKAHGGRVLARLRIAVARKT